MTSPPGPAYSFVCPPNWPQPPAGWVPPVGWQPDPSWGPAPEGWQFWQPVAPTPAQVPIDGFAVATLISGIVGSLIFAAIFGGVSLSRIRRGIRRGRNLVVIGWVLTALWLVVGIGYVAWLGAQAPGRAPDGTVTRAGKVMATQLQVGDCTKIPNSDRAVLLQVDLVPCASLHNAQVFTILTLDAGSYPGDDEATRLGLDACSKAVPGFFAGRTRIAPGLHVYSLTAGQADWKKGDHSTRCLLLDATGDFTGDVRDR